MIAEPRAAIVNLTAVAISDEFPFNLEPGRRRIWDLSLGKEIPLVGGDLGNRDGVILPAKGEWGWGIWLPVGFHMAEDFKDPSVPILNTDYRFAAMFKSQWGLSDPENLDAPLSRIGFRFQVGHESTHLGDEFSLNARNNHTDFLRVNVSYEYWEYGLSFETDPGAHTLIFRHGGIGLLRPDQGFYSNTLLETPDPNRPTIFRSVNNFEPSFGFEWKYNEIVLRAFAPFVSADVRHKAIYDYHKTSASAREDKQFSINLLIGIRQPKENYLPSFNPNIYFRFYHGVNPHGQFRSQRDYTLVGVGIQFPL